MAIRKKILALILSALGGLPVILYSQTSNYWTRSFNEESSLLAGAVVGGGAGPTAIYYNPASISEVVASKLTLNASLFSLDILNMKDALGDNIGINATKFTIAPRFVSYMIKSKRFSKWSFEIAILNNENGKASITRSEKQNIDILQNVPGDEKYFAFYKLNRSYRDDWIGAGASVTINEHLKAGASMFVTIKSLLYENSLEIEAYSLNDSSDLIPLLYVASYESNQYLKFNDYRLVWKAGLIYSNHNFSFGINITTPSLGGIYSDGKRVYRKEMQTNITSPETGYPLPDYVIVDYKEKGEMTVNCKTPFSVSAGFTLHRPIKEQTFYVSAEYFSKIAPYRWVGADGSPDISAAGIISGELLNDWLTYANGANAVFNAAFGLSWTLKQNLLLLGGFRTDFNNQKNLDYKEFVDFQKYRTIQTNLYHFSCGLSWRIAGQDLITGLQYTLGYNKDMKQLVNLSDPVEYNFTERAALQGTRTNDMKQVFHSISIYFGASFNFGED